MAFTLLEPLAANEEDDAGLLRPFTPGGDFSLSLIPAAADLKEEDKRALRGWKRLCDSLLPALRSRGHLHNLIHRHRHNCSLVLVQEGNVIGGATFRLLSSSGPGGDPPRLLLDVLLLAVAQRPGVCGQGHATRVINCLKSLLRHRATSLRATPILLTQADLGEQALAFWSRQGLRDGEASSELVQALHAWNAHAYIVYDYTVPMSLTLDTTSELAFWRCEERTSARAQSLNEEHKEHEEEEEVEAAPAAAPPPKRKATAERRRGAPGPTEVIRLGPRCLHCGLDDHIGDLLRCDVCSLWCHAHCAHQDTSHAATTGTGAGGGRGGDDEEDSAPAESLTCRVCADGLSALNIGSSLSSTCAAT
jgi:hypothetical protein